MGAQQPSKLSAVAIAQNVLAALATAAVLGIWDNSRSQTEQLTRVTAGMEGMRRDVDRHESIFLRYGYTLPEYQAEVRRETQRNY
ncbi:MAG: hypothetical protein K0S46_2199 [Moraxellaceae bacterium]|jgi:hypothetical protein|nr:hypothetical protein [Moraxellaceae bacterium]